jgi:BrxA
MATSRSAVVSSFTVIKGSLIDETYAAFAAWDFSLSKVENLQRLERDNTIRASSRNWARDVRKVLNRRFDPIGRDRPLVVLAQGQCDPDIWRPLLLWHMTRDEFLVQDFLINWLYPQYETGAYRVETRDVVGYLGSLAKKNGIAWSGRWTQATRDRVASGLLRITADFGLLTGGARKEFSSYNLPDESFLYLLYAMSAAEQNARRLIESSAWRMYLMDSGDVEREILRLHQFHRLSYEAAGSLATLDLPANSPLAYAEDIVA